MRYPMVELCFHASLVEEDLKLNEPGLAAYRLFSPDRQRELEALLGPQIPDPVTDGYW
jgi:hypothetical protein